MVFYKTLRWDTRVWGVVLLGSDKFCFEIQTYFLGVTKTYRISGYTL
jgi:hypothetical protein